MRDLTSTILRRPKLTLTGLLVIVAAFLCYSFWLQADLPAQMPLIIGQRLKEELTTEAADQFLHVSVPNGHATAEESKQFDEIKQAIDQLQIVSLNKRGLGSRVVVKVKFHLDGNWQPEGEDTRYYRLRFSWTTGWRFPYRVNEQIYQSAWFFCFIKMIPRSWL
jgi:hypothetical protein